MSKIDGGNFPVIDIKGTEYFRSYKDNLFKYGGDYEPFWIAGIYYYKDNVKEFIEGRLRGLKIKHEPSKKYPHALAIYGAWVETDDKRHDNNREIMLGHVPDSEARRIFEIMVYYKDMGQKSLIIPSILEINKEKNSIKMDLEFFIYDLNHSTTRSAREKGVKCYYCGSEYVIPFVFFISDDGVEYEYNQTNDLMEGYIPDFTTWYCVDCKEAWGVNNTLMKR